MRLSKSIKTVLHGTYFRRLSLQRLLSPSFQNMFHGALGNLWRTIRGLDFDLNLIEFFFGKKIKKKTKTKKQVPSCNCVTHQIPIYLYSPVH